ncbi:MAG: pantoate--beta-alanine ligase [Thermoleophilia bacterium]|nr:pantoate--beta-alanine ligase [Thermoleophilia bacterium]
MRIVETIADLRAALAPHRGTRSLGLVPTMGAFHAGHVSLIRASRAENDATVVSLFVNPSQFAAGEDLDRYPRDPERDASVAAEAGADLLFAPPAAEMYPEGFQTWVDVEGLSRGLEGDARPGHFRGVATVCLKLFTVVRPDRTYFGRKDAQQAAVIERLVCDLALELELRILPTVRDADGLALSSRNAYLAPDERAAALALPRALAAGLEAHEDGSDPVEVAAAVLAGERGIATDYVDTLAVDGLTVLAAAIRVGTTRLIDNVVLEGDTP